MSATQHGASTDTAQEQYDEEDELSECPACGGSGQDSLESFMPCEECDGEGYRWWE